MLKVYNTLSGKKENFRTKKDKKVNLFVCGPTVYDLSHLGHARTYIVFDMIVKYLRGRKYDVFYLQNITDIDDKIINRAKEKNISTRKLAGDFKREYLKDMKALKIDAVSRYARATGHIKEIRSQVERLLQKRYAYRIEDGIYYDISKFKRYGRLSKRTVLQAEDAVSRIDESKGKKNKGDFCLWKFILQQDKSSGKNLFEPSWPSPFGRGRPGWHIEDTAITEKYFGPKYDVHGGANELIFPHHEAEIAQMEAISGKRPLVKYWLHTGLLTIKGQKMSKSLGNFITIRDFLKENSARILRLLIIKTHYRSPIDYSEQMISQAIKELEKIDEFLEKLKVQKSTAPLALRDPKLVRQLISRIRKDFKTAMKDDFNTPQAIAAVFTLIKEGNYLIAQNKVGPRSAKNFLKFLKEIDGFFNFIFSEKNKTRRPAGKEKNQLLILVRQREECRKKELWQEADEIRKKIKELGYLVEDTEKGPKIKISNF